MNFFEFDSDDQCDRLRMESTVALGKNFLLISNNKILTRKTRFQIAKVPFLEEKIRWKILLALKEFWKSPAKTAIHCEQWLRSECYIHQMLKSYSWYSKHENCLSYKPNGWLWKPSMEKVKISNANRLYHFHKVKCVKRDRIKQISIKKSPAWNINWTIRSFF